MAGYYPGHSLVIMGEWAYKNVYGSAPNFQQTPLWWASWLSSAKSNSQLGPKIKQLLASKKQALGPMGAVMEVLTSNMGNRISDALMEGGEQAGPGEVAHTTLLVNQPGAGRMSDQQYYGLTRKATEWAARAVANRQVDIGYLDLVIVNMGLQQLYDRRLPIWQNPTGPNPTQEEIISWTAFLKATHWSGPGSVISWYSDYSQAAWQAQSAAYERYDQFLGVVQTTLKYVSLQAPAEKAMELIQEFFGIKAKVDAALQGTEKIMRDFPEAATAEQRAKHQANKDGVRSIYDSAYAALNPVGLWDGSSTSVAGLGNLGATTAVIIGIKAAVWITLAGAAAYMVHRITSYLGAVEENNAEVTDRAMSIQEGKMQVTEEEYKRKVALVDQQLKAGSLTTEEADLRKQELYAWFQTESNDIAEKAAEIQANKTKSSGGFTAGIVAVTGLAAVGLIGYFTMKN